MKLLIVKSAVESRWGSCKVISPNLHQLYLELGPAFKLDWFDLPEDLMKSELQTTHSSIVALLKHIESTKPERIVFVDHLPPPPRVLAYLSMLINLKKLPPIFFHLYGDFTYFSREWSFINEVYDGHPTRFIVASHSQKKLVSSFLEKSDDQDIGIDEMCFPVNSSDYFFNPTERHQLRQEMNIGENDVIVLYSGRISLQKNVELLISDFLKLVETEKKYHLWIVGAFDDVGADFIGYESYQGYMFSKIQAVMEEASPEQRERIKFWGQQKKTELRKIKSACDLFVSLSLYHDEDYGMSPAEALATGLPSLLTDWGGYSSFADSQEWDCQLVPVSLSEFGFEIDMHFFRSELERMTKNILDLNSRQRRSEAFLSKFSIKSNISTLTKILETPPVAFKKFNWLLDQYGNALSLNWSKSKFNKFLSPNHRGYYFDIYKNYISKINKDSINEK